MAVDNFNDPIEETIRQCCSLIRHKKSDLRYYFDRLAKISDQRILNDISIKAEDVQQEQADARRRLWEYGISEDYEKFDKLINYVKKFLTKNKNGE